MEPRSVIDHFTALYRWVITSFDWIFAVFIANALSVLVLLAGLAVIGKMINEKRNPSNFFAWTLLLFIFPIGGLLLFGLFGGRKSRRLVAAKRLANERAAVALARASAAAGQANVPQDRSTGNAARILGDGVSAWQAFAEEIQQANESIHIMTYILGHGGTGRRIVELLAQRAREGVKVRLLVDAYGSFFAAKRGVLRPLRRAGGEAAEFLPLLPLHTPTSANLRNHRKIAIFDGCRAIVGGQNLDGRFISARATKRLFHDFSLHLEGPVAASLQRTFLTDWAFATGADLSSGSFDPYFAFAPPAAGDLPLEVVTGGPDSIDDPVWERLLTLIQEARRDIFIVTPYFVPDEVLFQSLVVKAHAGRRVRILVPEHSNHPLVDAARDHFLRRLAVAGAEILLFQPRMLHGKLLVVDGKVAFTGSANIDQRSLFVNFEIGLVHTDPGDVADLERWAEELLPHCVRFEASTRAASSRYRRVAEDFAHLLVPLL